MKTPVDRTLGLVLRARRGDEAAYDRLFALAYERLRLYVRLRLGRRLRERLDSDDVLQDTYLAAHRDFERFRWQGDASFTRWLCRIAEHRLRGLADHHGAAKRVPPGGLARVEALLEGTPGGATGPVSAVVRRDETRRLVGALERIEDESRELLLLRFHAGMTQDEIAALTGHSRAAVRRRLERATQGMARAMRGDA